MYTYKQENNDYIGFNKTKNYNKKVLKLFKKI